MNGADRELNVLINAYAVSPNWGSEQGMGWHWVTNIAKYCHVDVITEGEWKDEIEDSLKNLPQKKNLRFHYLPVSARIRKMCWNQGDWRFYWHYQRWQRRALELAKVICEDQRIDIIHQLNMIGFREPGYLWSIKDIPFVWGPIGGMELMPMSYLRGASRKQILFNRIKNIVNRYQYTHSARVRYAIERSAVLIAAFKGVKVVLSDIYNRESVLINETGSTIDDTITRACGRQDTPLKVLWVGKFDFRKQLAIALRTLIATGRKNIELHICGIGSESVMAKMKAIAEAGGIGTQCYWHGNVSHDKILGMMAQSDLLFFTSIMEATSTVVLEAISVGLPILSFNTCGFGPLVKNFAGITIEVSDPDRSVQDFARELMKLEENRAILDRVSELIVEKRHMLTWDSKAKEVVKLYKEAIRPDNQV